MTMIQSTSRRLNIHIRNMWNESLFGSYISCSILRQWLHTVDYSSYKVIDLSSMSDFSYLDKLHL